MGGLIASPVAATIAVALALGMGLAIQRGGTCMVDAVGQLVRHRRAARLAAIAEAAVLATLLMAMADRAGIAFPEPREHPVGIPLVIGAMLLGIGASVNGACLFGTVARIGARQMAWTMTPLGFVAGSVLVRLTGFMPGSARAVGLSLAGLGVLAALLALFNARRIPALALSPVGADDRRFLYGTLALAVLAVGLTALVGAWSWSDTAARLADRGHAPDGLALLLTAGLFAGSALGGKGVGPTWSRRRAGQCFAGGALMGIGGAIVPGGNDALVLNGLPTLAIYAWAAVAIMVGTVIAALWVEARLAARRG